MSNKQKSRSLYPHPFSRAYWRDAAAELKDTRILVIAALLIAIRVAMKGVYIPLAPNLNINLGYFVNALGAMIFGPVVAGFAAAVSDTLGCMLFPKGAYFFPFIFIEIAGSMIFAMFLYRAKVTVTRLVLSRFCVSFFVNIVLNMPVMALYYKMVMHQSYTWMQLPTIAKNLSLFPLESLLLILFMSVMIPIVFRMDLVYSSGEGLKVTKKVVIGLVSLFLVATVSTGSYLIYNYNTSNQASWLDREDKVLLNEGLTRQAIGEGLMEEDQVCVIRRVFRKVGEDEAQLVFDIYDTTADTDAEKVMTYRSTDAKKDETLQKLVEGSAVVKNNDMGRPYDLAVKAPKE